MKKFLAILLALTLVVSLFACGGAAAEEAAPEASNEELAEDIAEQNEDSTVEEFALEDVKAYAADVETEGMQFYWVGKVLGGTYWTGVEIGMTAAAEELGMKEIVMQGVEKETDIDVQLNNLQNAVAANPDAILAAPCDSMALDQPIKDAAEVYDGPIVLVDTVISTAGGYDVALLTDNRNAGATVAKILMQGLQEAGVTEGTVGFECVNQGSQTVIDRMDGFKEYWSANAADMGLDGVECLWNELKVSEGDSNLSMSMGADLITAHADLVGMAGFNGSSVYFLTSLKEAGRNDIVGVGMDFNVDSYDLMEQGFEYGGVAQSTYNMGYYGVYLAVAVIAGQDFGGTRIDSGLLEVYADDLQNQAVQDYIAILKSAA
jgi:ribose transport system substrate-binding protein